MQQAQHEAAGATQSRQVQQVQEMTVGQQGSKRNSERGRQQVRCSKHEARHSKCNTKQQAQQKTEGQQVQQDDKGCCCQADDCNKAAMAKKKPKRRNWEEGNKAARLTLHEQSFMLHTTPYKSSRAGNILHLTPTVLLLQM
jgi:hypothetical protein